VDNLLWKRLWTCHKTNRNIHFTALKSDATGLKAQSYIMLKKRGRRILIKNNFGVFFFFLVIPVKIFKLCFHELDTVGPIPAIA